MSIAGRTLPHDSASKPEATVRNFEPLGRGTTVSKHYPPTYEQPHFNCPHCQVYAVQRWASADLNEMDEREVWRSIGFLPDFRAAICQHCRSASLWMNKQMIYPDAGAAPAAHDDMPEFIRGDFEEARTIVSKSPRGAAALLRLSIQKLMKELGEKGQDINTDIGSLVQKGLPVQIQQALDAVRVVGNEAVHPGTIDLNDSPEVAYSLFGLVNVIVDNQIAQPKRIAQLYSQLPASKLQGIQRRDAPKT